MYLLIFMSYDSHIMGLISIYESNTRKHDPYRQLHMNLASNVWQAFSIGLYWCRFHWAILSVYDRHEIAKPQKQVHVH